MKFDTQLLKGIAPAIVLQTLSRGSKYGYQIGTELRDKSDEIFSLQKGTLYPLLYNLESKKLIRGRWERKKVGRRRRFYTITPKGKKQLADQKKQLKELNAGLQRVFGAVVIPP
jgi:PadR family transcriptional regulator PadR